MPASEVHTYMVWRISSQLKIFKENAGLLWTPPIHEFPVWLVSKSLSHKEF